MVFGRKFPKIENPDVPRGFKGRQRVLAAIVQAALRQADYEACFLSGAERPGLSIGISGPNAIGVGNVRDLAGFTWKDAQLCAAKLNNVFRSAGCSTELAIARRDTTFIGNVRYAEVVVQCSSDSTLRALYKKLVK